MFGRRRYLPDINSKNPSARSAAERTAVNTPIQGSAADLVKRAMLLVDAALRGKYQARMLLQVHDELVLEAPPEEVEAVFELPIAILLLSAFGLVTPAFLAKFRRHAILGSYVAAAIITPGDLFVTSIALMIPLYLLYEASILVATLVDRSHRRTVRTYDPSWQRC